MIFLQGAISKKKEFDRLSSEGKIGQSEATEVANRTDTLSFALLAEINTFHHQRVKDMKTAHQHFLQEQITFYQKVRKYFSGLSALCTVLSGAPNRQNFVALI